MSELTPCNYCSLRRIREHAKEDNLKVTLIPSSFMEGTDVYVHPKDVKIKALDNTREQFFEAWLMEIPNKCCC